jgi:hypothetical protein
MSKKREPDASNTHPEDPVNISITDEGVAFDLPPEPPEPAEPNTFDDFEPEGTPPEDVADPMLFDTPRAADLLFDELGIVVTGEVDINWGRAGKQRNYADVRVKIKRALTASEARAVESYVPGAADVYAKGTPDDDGEEPMSGLQTQRNSKSEDALDWKLTCPDVPGESVEAVSAVVDVASVAANSGKITLTLAIKFMLPVGKLATVEAMQGTVARLEGRRMQPALL